MKVLVQKEDKNLKRKVVTDKAARILLLSVTILCSLFVILITLFIVYKGIVPFFKTYEVEGNEYRIDLFKFLTGNMWFKNPNIYGAGYVIVDTIFITFMALLVAVPISVLTALFISRIAPKWLAKILNGAIELLASIPSVIYGLFGLMVITTMVKNISSLFGFQSAGGLSGLSAAIVLAMMIIPTITMLSVTAIGTVKEDQVLGSLALGCSRTETNFKVVLKAARSGIFSGIILGLGRALGEATAVSMVIGNAGLGPNFNPFDTSRTLTSTMLLSMHETSGMDYDIRFSVGMILILVILLTNIGLNAVKRKMSKYYGK